MAETALVGTSTANKPDRRFFGTTAGFKVGGAAISSIFSFAIFDLEQLAIVTPDIKLDPADRTALAMYQFPVSPSSYEVSEPQATSIIPTQDGGKFIESHGSVFKDIRIQGTVGFRPSVPSAELIGGLQASTGINTQVPSTLGGILFNDERGLNRKEATGFDDIIFLRNLFRFYGDLKADPEQARKVVLIWTYAKESESYIVEPMNFTTARDSGNPLSWNYSIQLRTIHQISATFTAVKDPMNIFQAFNKAMEMFTRISQDLSRSLNTLADTINFVTQLPFDVVDTLLGGGLSVLNGMASIKNSLKFAGSLPEGKVKAWQQSAREAMELLSEDTADDDGAGQEGAVGRARHVCKQMMQQANMLRSLDFLWEEVKQVQVADYSDAYRDEIGSPPITTGSPLNVANISIPSSAREEQIIAGESIRDLAKRLTGNEANWKKLAILNNLRPPYIASVASDGVLGYEDAILVPKPAAALEDEGKVPRQLDEDAAFQALPKIEQRYGRDLRIINSSLGTDLADVSVNQRGDLETIQGPDNVEQAVMIKFSTEQGELATHPHFGAKYPAGTKFPSLDRLTEFSLNSQRTLRQDPRIIDVDEIRIFVDGDRLLFNAKAKLISSDTRLPVAFALRR
jgi:hypothetical protein